MIDRRVLSRWSVLVGICMSAGLDQMAAEVGMFHCRRCNGIAILPPKQNTQAGEDTTKLADLMVT